MTFSYPGLPIVGALWLTSPRIGPALCCAGCFDENDFEDVLLGQAYDAVAIQSSGGRLYHNTEFLVSFPRGPSPGETLVLEVGLESSAHAWFPVLREDSGTGFDWRCIHDGGVSSYGPNFDGETAGETGGYVQSTLLKFLVPGRNPIRYLLLNEDKQLIGVAHASLFLWSYKDRILVSDIDGTITKSNTRSVFDTILTENYLSETYRNCHDGICQLLSIMASEPDVKVLYLTSRPIALASHTRTFINRLRQGKDKLPSEDAAILGFGGNLSGVLFMELLSKRTHHFKAETLIKHVVEPHRLGAEDSKFSSALFAGLGNTQLDVQAYHMAGLPLKHIYLINERSQITAFDKRLPGEVASLMEADHAAKDGLPRAWYTSRMGSTFQGYMDPALLKRIQSVDTEGERTI